MHKRLQATRDREDDEAERKILQIIQREKDKQFWRRLKYALGKVRGGAVNEVHIQHEGQTLAIKSRDKLHQAIWDEVHRKRFHLAEEAPICQGKLRGDFGYLANTKASRQALEGTYRHEEGVHQATKELLEEVARIRAIVPKKSVPDLITRRMWQQRWRKATEKTSSSESTLHFRHYITGAKLDYISHLRAMMTSLALRRVFAYKRWARGLSVILEKELGNKLISKLRAILLMEADFNFWQQADIWSPHAGQR